MGVTDRGACEMDTSEPQTLQLQQPSHPLEEGKTTNHRTTYNHHPNPPSTPRPPNRGPPLRIEEEVEVGEVGDGNGEISLLAMTTIGPHQGENTNMIDIMISMNIITHKEHLFIRTIVTHH